VENPVEDGGRLNLHLGESLYPEQANAVLLTIDFSFKLA
jgi:hypothetical protein